MQGDAFQRYFLLEEQLPLPGSSTCIAADFLDFVSLLLHEFGALRAFLIRALLQSAGKIALKTLNISIPIEKPYEILITR